MLGNNKYLILVVIYVCGIVLGDESVHKNKFEPPGSGVLIILFVLNAVPQL